MSSKFSRHIGKGEPLVIDSDEFILKPLGTEFIPDFFMAMKAFSGASTGGASVNDMLKNIDPDGLNAIRRIIDATLKGSYPEEWRKDQEELKTFGLKYMHLMIGKVFEINSAVDPREAGKAKIMNKLKQKADVKTET